MDITSLINICWACLHLHLFSFRLGLVFAVVETADFSSANGLLCIG